MLPNMASGRDMYRKNSVQNITTHPEHKGRQVQIYVGNSDVYSGDLLQIINLKLVVVNPLQGS